MSLWKPTDAQRAVIAGMLDDFDGSDATTQLDGSRCPCGGVVVSEPVEAHAAPRLRCRECGERNNL